MPRRSGESVFRKKKETNNATSSEQPASDLEWRERYEKSRLADESQQESFQSQSSSAHQSEKGPLSAENEDDTTLTNGTSSIRRRSSRFSTKSSDTRKPWLGGSATSPSEGGPKSVQRTSSSDHVLHAPRLSESTPPASQTESKQILKEGANFDDLWDESNRSADDHVELVPHGKTKTPQQASKAGTASKEFDTRRFANHDPKPTPDKTSEKSSNLGPSRDASSGQKPPHEDKISEKPPETVTAPKELDTRRFASAKKVNTPPNTPNEESHAVAENPAEDAAQEELPKRVGNPIRHRRSNSQDSTDKPRRTPRRTNSKDSASSDNSHRQRHPRKIKLASESKQEAKIEESEKPKKVYKDKDEAIATLEKQLERVSFLQRRQYDQLSSLKQMLLASRAKEREHVDTNEELGKVLEDKEARIEQLEQQMENQSSLRDLRQALKEKEARIKQLEKNPIPAMQYPSADIEKKLKAKDDKIAELQLHLEAKESEMGNALAVTESKLRKKSQNYEQLHAELEEMRSSLTNAQTTIETLEEERNFSQAKMSELNEMVKQKGGMTDTDTELLERAAEIANLSSKLKGLDGKIQGRDDKIYKLEEQMKSMSDLVKQLSDIFCAEDDQLKYQQDLLVESAESPGQSCSLLLMTMMNMLEAMKTKMATLKQERDDSNAKASDRGIQLAESHIRVDKLRTELRRLRAERARFRQGAPNPNSDPNARGPQTPGAEPPQGRPVTPGQQGTPTNNDTTPPRSNVQNQRPPQHQQPIRSPPPEQRRNSFGNNAKMHNGSEKSHQSKSSISTAPPASATPAPTKNRFMNFLKNNLKLEEEPQRGKNGGRSKPMIAMT